MRHNLRLIGGPIGRAVSHVIPLVTPPPVNSIQLPAYSTSVSSKP